MLSENSRNEWTRRLEAGVSLYFAPKVVRDDKELVMMAVQKNGMDLEFASERLQRDIEVVEKAITQDIMAIQFVNEELMQQIISLGIDTIKQKLFSSYSEETDDFWEVRDVLVETGAIEDDLADAETYFRLRDFADVLRYGSDDIDNESSRPKQLVKKPTK